MSKFFVSKFFGVVIFLGLCSCASNDLPGPNCDNPTVSFNSDIKPIIEMSCLINNSECHGMNSTIPNWGIFSEVQSSAELIKTKTSDRSMPKVGSLTQTQIDLITCWVEQGANDN